MSSLYVLDYSASPVTTSAYTTIVTATPTTISNLQIADTSGQLLKLATGLPGQEVDFCTTPMGANIVIPCYIPQGVRVAIKSLTDTASNGLCALSFLK